MRLMRFFKWAAAMGLSLLGGCGDSGGGGAGAGGGEPGSCDPLTLCLDVVEEGSIPEARFAVVWFRIEGSVAADPTVAIDVAFDASANDAEVSLADVPLPPDIDKICERDCAEPVDCPVCSGEFEASVAYVMVIVDADMSGAIEPTEVAEPNNVVGIANAAIVWSNTDQSTLPAPFDATFPDGTVEGRAVYSIGSGSSFEPAGNGEQEGHVGTLRGASCRIVHGAR